MAKKTKNLFTLMQPVVRKDSEIGQVEITGAISQAGSLRGLNLIRVANMDADSIATLLTRVTAPALTQKKSTRCTLWTLSGWQSFWSLY